MTLNKDFSEGSSDLASRSVLFTAVKNEAPFLLEWVAYHLVIGFTDIVVYANSSNDGTNELLQALDDGGYIHYRHSDPRGGKSPQLHAATSFIAEKFLRSGDYVCWLDADEFLNIHVGDRTVNALVAALEGKAGMLINWRVFSAPEGVTFKGRHISSDFIGCRGPYHCPDKEVKTFIRFDRNVLGLWHINMHRPLLAPDSGYGYNDFLTGSGGPLAAIPRNDAWLSGNQSTTRLLHAVRSEERGYSLAQINHYMYRTKSLFKLKNLRGQGDQLKGETSNRYNMETFEMRNKTEGTDASILYWEQAVTDKMAAMLADPEIQRTQVNAIKLMELSIAQVEAIEERDEQFVDNSISDVESRIEQASVILEYGTSSTGVAAAITGLPKKTVFSVDCRNAYQKRIVSDALGNSPLPAGLNLHLVDIGRVGRLGIPRDTSGWHNYYRYSYGIWQHPNFVQPDLVLISGRFRVACFLACAHMTEKPITVLFSNYEEREQYHVVEEIARPVETVNGTARFELQPRPIGRTDIFRIFEALRLFD